MFNKNSLRCQSLIRPVSFKFCDEKGHNKWLTMMIGQIIWLIFIFTRLVFSENSKKKRAHNDRRRESTSFRALFVQLRTTFLSPRGYFTLLYRKHRMCPTNSLLCLLREILEFLQFLLCCSSNSYCFVKTFTKIQKMFPLKRSSLKFFFCKPLI